MVAMPNTDPAQDCVSVVEFVRAQGRRAGLFEVLPSGCITVGRNGAQLAPFGELAEGYEDPAAPGLEELIAPYGIVEITRSIGRRYAMISRALRIAGGRWGDNDLWIGATALEVGIVQFEREQRHRSLDRLHGLA